MAKAEVTTKELKRATQDYWPLVSAEMGAMRDDLHIALARIRVLETSLHALEHRDLQHHSDLITIAETFPNVQLMTGSDTLEDKLPLNERAMLDALRRVKEGDDE